MKKILYTIAALCIIAASVSCKDRGGLVVPIDQQPQLANKNDSLSWALGFTLAQNIASTGVDINREVLFQAICNTLDSKQQPMTQEQTYILLNELEQRAQEYQMENSQSVFQETRAREAAYFSQLMKDNPNVKKSDKGFYYEVLKEGNGRQGAYGLVVVFDYKGTFTNGQIFDQTYGNREPITHIVGETLMPGLFEAFCMMRAGSTYRFYFPCEMAFGEKGTENIPPFSTVIYEVELHEVRDL